MHYPVDDAIPELAAVLARGENAVLEAPPGAGKTTRVPPALLDAPWLGNRVILMLEPRRLAARNAAAFMARTRGEEVGETIGYRVRGDTRVGRKTRIEIVTEGVLARLRASDPALERYGAVLFDEFHERSLHADLGLALVLETQQLVRPDLRVVAMSATLDGLAVSRLIGQDNPAPVVRSSGRMFPVETLHRPPRPDERLESLLLRTTRDVLQETDGDVLVFLPGMAEQLRARETLASLRGTFPLVDVHVLHGTQSFAEQEAAIAPSPQGRRKVVLATNVAETSITIEGVRVVVDAGLSRVPRYTPRTGLTRLETVRVSQASADQRRGRAGRVAPGWCYRLWNEFENASLPPRTTPEILDADLSSLALELADAGVTDARDLRWLDTPPEGALAQARELLVQLGALDANQRITAHGREIAALPVSPRLAHLLVSAREKEQSNAATTLCALLEERDILRGQRGEVPADMTLRFEIVSSHIRDAAHDGAHDAQLGSSTVVRDAVQRVRRLASELRAREARHQPPLDGRNSIALENHALSPTEVGALLALAYPDRIAQRRPGSAPRFLLRNGSGGALPPHDSLANEPWLVCAELDGAPPEYRIVRAAAVSLDDVLEMFASQVKRTRHVWWDDTARAVRGANRDELGAIVLREQREQSLSDGDALPVVAEELRSIGSAAWPMSRAALATLSRIDTIARIDQAWPPMSREILEEKIEDWLLPHLAGVRTWGDLERVDWMEAILSLLSWQQRAQLDELAPTHIEVPSGSHIAIDYSDAAAPVLPVKLQEVFGWTDTPRIAGGRLPLTLHLLSPAQRPVQVTRDLAGFWRSSYFEVRKELRGRYPRHPWPDDPLTAPATRRAKPRGT